MVWRSSEQNQVAVAHSVVMTDLRDEAICILWQSISVTFQLFFPIQSERKFALGQRCAINRNETAGGERIVKACNGCSWALCTTIFRLVGCRHRKMRNYCGCVVIAVSKSLGDAAPKTTNAHGKVQLNLRRIGKIR